jgi:hypothetical protein
MPFPCPAASRPKVSLFATFAAGVALLVAHPAQAANDHAGHPSWMAGAPASDGWQYRSSAVSDAADDSAHTSKSWLASQDYHFSVARGPSYPNTYGGGAKDQAVRISRTVKW